MAITGRFVADVSDGVANDCEGCRVVDVVRVRASSATHASHDVRTPVGTGSPSWASVPRTVESVQTACCLAAGEESSVLAKPWRKDCRGRSGLSTEDRSDLPATRNFPEEGVRVP